VRVGITPIVVLLLLTLLLSPLAAMREASAASFEDYPGQYKVVTSFDSTASEGTPYGNWSYTPSVFNGTATNSSRTFGSPNIEGLAAVQLSFNVAPTYSAGDWLQYEFSSNLSRNLLQVHTPVIAYRGNHSNYVYAAVRAWACNATGTVLSFQSYDLSLDDQWYSIVFDHLYHPDAVRYNVTLRLGTIVWDKGVGDFGYGNVSLDLMYAQSPPCYVRFSFFNEYSGLGLESEILIPEVYYDGDWKRVWNNEIVIAAGEWIAYRIRDYFDRTVDLVTYYELDETIEYIDISVPLVEVHISQPDWYNSTLPPEWQITYLPNGNSIAATGWSIELLAGWYTFSWSDDGFRSNGSVDQYVEGNASAGSAYAMFDFSLALSPTYEGEGSTFDGSLIPDLSFLSWDGLKELAVTIYESWEFKLFSIVGVAGSMIILGYRSKKAAEEEGIIQ
jgi:hypothetical protein